MTVSGELHNVLEVACRARGVDAKRYIDGPKPVIDNHGYVSLSVWMTERAFPLLDKPSRTRIDPILEIARASLRGERINHSTLSKLGDESVTGQLATPAAEIAAGLCFETIESSINNVCGKGSRAIATAIAKRLDAGFLDDLAREIARLDAITMIRRQELVSKKTKIEIAACLWRGATGVKATHIIVRLEDGSHGLIAKTKGRWTWQVGERDHILASIPDAQMESAVSAVLGGPLKKEAKKEEEEQAATISDTARFSSRVVGVAMNPEQTCCFIVTRDGRLYEWPSGRQRRESSGPVGKVAGIHAGRGGVVATWGSVLTRWRDLVPATITEDADVEGAFVRDDGSLVWWHGDEIRFGAKKVRGEEDQSITVCAAASLVVSVTSDHLRKYSLEDGKIIGELGVGGTSYALSSDGTKIATWKRGAKAKDVTIASLDDGKILLTLTVDSGKIDHVVLTDDGKHVAVRYHEGQRVAVFDAVRGTRTHRIQAREIGSSGSRVHDLFPLRTAGPKGKGMILAFAPYPRGETLLVDYDAQLLQRWSLGKLYSGGASFVAEGSTNAPRKTAGGGTYDVLFAHGLTSSYALRFRFPPMGAPP